MKSIEERQLDAALKKARRVLERLDEVVPRMSPREAEPLLRSAHSMVTNLAMAADVLRRQKAAGEEPDQP
jgi:hypothetical protein